MKHQQQMSYKLKRSPIRIKKKKRSKKQTEKAKRLEKEIHIYNKIHLHQKGINNSNTFFATS